ncbi:hypothetical protein [Streptomyces zaehneri]|uniref:hypothetical protein n=1 Tax=Streptomyces zaehneri TaxID=3051180 RepID=UPI0028D65AD1|nr:hypothetical protein [Streptomyces sp. DSM 40713]
MFFNGPAHVQTNATLFPASTGVPVEQDLPVLPQDLARALFITGRAPYDQTKHGRSSAYEWCHRVAVLPAYLGWSDDPVRRITRTDLARELDPSEKGMLSYTLGQAMCQIFAERQLSVRFFMHVARYASAYNLAFAPGRSRADFFGERTVGGYVVAEAKGRSGPLTHELREAMEEQKRTVKTIKGKAPKIAYASAVHFSSPHSPMRLTAIDPDATAPRAVDLPVDPDLHVLAYYAPFLDAFAHQEPLVLGDYVVAGFAALGVTLGVLAPVLQRVERAARRNETAGLRDDILGLLARHRPRQERTLYIDGTLFAADWTVPEDRRRPGRRDSEVLPGFLHEAFHSLNEEDDWRVAPVEEGDLDWRDLSPARGYMPGIFPQGDLLEG